MAHRVMASWQHNTGAIAVSTDVYVKPASPLAAPQPVALPFSPQAGRRGVRPATSRLERRPYPTIRLAFSTIPAAPGVRR